jgi:hypothetical protein
VVFLFKKLILEESIMAIVIKRKIGIPFCNEEGKEIAKVFVMFAPKEELLNSDIYKKVVESDNTSDLETTCDHLKLIGSSIVGWEGIETEDGELEFNEFNIKLVAPLILEDQSAFGYFMDALRGITEKK